MQTKQTSPDQLDRRKFIGTATLLGTAMVTTTGTGSGFAKEQSAPDGSICLTALSHCEPRSSLAGKAEPNR